MLWLPPETVQKVFAAHGIGSRDLLALFDQNGERFILNPTTRHKSGQNVKRSELPLFAVQSFEACRAFSR